MGLVGLGLAVLVVSGCDSKEPAATAPKPEPVAASAAPEPEAPPPDASCTATGIKPTRLTNLVGNLYGFGSDKGHVYYATWDAYGARGVVGRVRKDGQGATTLAVLELEPRGLALDDQHVYYTAGVRLMKVPLGGGAATVVSDRFSAQAIAIYGNDVYGVPGDYGPYDRVAKIPKAGGDITEIFISQRPEASTPAGYNGLAVDQTGIYVADSGGNRVFQLPLEGGKQPKMLAAKQPKAYGLHADAEHVYWSLAQRGELYRVKKVGGKPIKVASGLAPNARFGLDSTSIVASFRGTEDGQVPAAVSRLSLDGSEDKPLATVEHTDAVQGLALDEKCVYFAQRNDSNKIAINAIPR
jgi:hypothetical protein